MQFLYAKLTSQTSLDFQLRKPSMISPTLENLAQELMELAEQVLRLLR